MRHITDLNNIIGKNLNQIYKSISSIKYLDIYLFAISIIILVIAQCIQYPSLTYHAEIYVENGTNFFIHAYQDKLLANLFITDAGYLPLTQRLIALLVVKGFHIIAWYPYFTQFFAIIFIAVSSSLITLNIFRNFSHSLLIRFLLGLAIGLISDYELHVFINFIYYGAIILFLLLFLNKENISKFLLFILGLLSGLIILSKGQFVVFLPIFIVFAIVHFRKKEYRSFGYFLIVILAASIQLIVIKSNSQGAHVGLFLVPYYFIKTLYYFVLSYRHVFLGYVLKPKINLIIIPFLFMLFIIAIKKLIREKKYQVLTIFFVGNFIAICSLFLTVIVLNNNINSNFVGILSKVSPSTRNLTIAPTPHPVLITTSQDVRKYQSIFDDKHLANLRSLFFSNLFIFLTGILVLIAAVPKKSYQLFIIILFFLTSGAFAQFKGEEPYQTRNLSFSQWSIYSQMLGKHAYCIPINNYPNLITKNCTLLYTYSDSIYSIENPVKDISLSRYLLGQKHWNIQAIILMDNQIIPETQMTMFAFNKNGVALGKARQLTPINYKYEYYLFDKPVKDATYVSFINEKGKIQAVIPHVTILGTAEKGKNEK